MSASSGRHVDAARGIMAFVRSVRVERHFQADYRWDNVATSDSAAHIRTRRSMAAMDRKREPELRCDWRIRTQWNLYDKKDVHLRVGMDPDSRCPSRYKSPGSVHVGFHVPGWVRILNRRYQQR